MNQYKNNKIGGFIMIVLGLALMVFGPVNFRGAPVNSSVGLIACIVGILFVGLSRNPKNK